MLLGLRSIASDGRLALRRMGQRPGFAASIVLSLALAIGASAISFSILDAVRFRALPLPGGDRLVVLSERQADADGTMRAAASCEPTCSVSYIAYKELLSRREFQSIELMSAFATGGKALFTGDDVQTVSGVVSSPALFALLAAQPEVGRLFTQEDNELGAAPVALLGHGLWASRYGRDPGIIGKPVQLSDTRYTVIGVMPEGFDFEFGSQFWLPERPALDPSTRPSITSVTVIARLAPNASLDQFRVELAGLDLASIRRADGAAGRRYALTAVPLRERYIAGTQGYDVLFLVIVACVLVIACANVTNLLLARALGDRRTFSIRTALGAEGLQLVRLIAVEHLMLVVMGAALGVFVAWLSLPLVSSVDVLNSQRLAGMGYHIDLHVTAFSVAVAALVAIAISVVPAAIALKGDVQPVLREHGAGGAGGTGRGYVERAFVIAQLACAVALVVCGGLATQRVLKLSRLDLGFNVANLVQATPSLPHDWRVREQYMPLTERIVTDLRSLPGAIAVSLQAFLPLDAATVTASGSTAPLPARVMPTGLVAVGPDYFETLQVRVVRGRTFTAADRERTMPVAIVNEWSAEHWWPDRDPVGESLQIASADGTVSSLTIVGVVADNRAAQSTLILSENGPLLYRPFDQAPSPFATYFVRTQAQPGSMVAPVRQHVARLVPNRPLSARVVADIVGLQLGGVRTTAVQLTGIAIVGLFIAVVGVHGLLAYNVNRRIREIGIRRVLGATTNGVLGLVLGEAARLAAIGVAIGLVLAAIAMRRIQPATGGAGQDQVVYAAAAIVALIAAVLSAYIPARRAASVSPQEALRS